MSQLDQIAADVTRLREQMNLLLTALETAGVLSARRDEAGEVVGLQSTVMPRMVQVRTRPGP